ncbi:HelD family protein [Actinokineospora globicatena]|uniref:HelD family protein n=1 Tax=Actinokineospora globicatena TaxID=103729 RepID=UPI0020A3F59E|nr:ATP-binding domain-containing protein [Actinokineospora globicatena]MCP2305546.1 DNA helicase IV [Actinokineospora globicatena]GLW81414.1 DNA helicase [Actinokineospora globicatena]GLW87888.1 DNA helicase [Actinokineospora globicatena]
MSETSVREAEIAVEQKHVDIVYARVAEMRHEAEAMRVRGDELAHGARNEAVFEQAAMLFERDVMVRHATQILRTLDAEHEGLVFGRLDSTDGETQYVGRLGVRDGDFENLVTDWRAPAAAPFYQATAEMPMQVIRRRVIRSTGQSVVDIDDDLLMPESRLDTMPVVGEGALIASLTRARGENMRDIVATIQKEQDEAIRAPWRGVTEITGGPGTGKTAVALHRVAYLLYRDRRRMGGTGVLVVGPSPAFTSYISRVLPSMGEDNVELRSLSDLLDGAAATRVDPAPVAAIKGSLRMRRILKRAIREAPVGAPTELRIMYRGEVLKLEARDLAAVRAAVHNGRRPPNASRVDAAEALLEALWRKADSYEDYPVKRAELVRDIGERIDFHRFVVVWWLLQSPAEALRALADRKVLARAAGRALTRSEVDMLADSFAEPGWSVADIALLDELRVLLGRPPKRRRRVDHDPFAPVSVASGRRQDYDEYSHIVVDEAQDLSPMQWRMVGRRGKYASWTVVGDPVQSSWPDPAEARQAMDTAFGGPRTQRRRFGLRTNYRNSAEIFDLAGKVVRDVATPDQLPHAVRSTGVDPTILVTTALTESAVKAAQDLLSEVDGTVGIITSTSRVETLRTAAETLANPRVRVVDGLESKGLEYDAVVLVEPEDLIRESSTGPRTLYVALTRATQRLTVITSNPSWPD